MRILIVEDDKIIGDGIYNGLKLEGYATDWVRDGEEAESAVSDHKYDLIILDLGLPDKSGFEVLKNIRKSNHTMPVLILTAYDDVTYKVKGLDAGADDYLIKPFDLNELYARVRALRRRSLGRASTGIKIGDVILDPVERTIFKGENPIDLSAKEFSILQLLMEKKGKVVSKNQIEDSLYGWGAEVESNTVEVYIHSLRRKIDKEFIKTIRHVGYMVG